MTVNPDVGINRQHSNLHYENIGALAEESVENLLNDFLDYYPGHKTKDVLNDIASGNKKKLVFLTPEYLMPFLDFIKSNRKLFSIVLNDGRVFRHNEAFNDLFKYILDQICALFDITTNKRKYYVHFFIDGTIGIIKEWLENDCRETPESIVEIIMRCLSYQKM